MIIVLYAAVHFEWLLLIVFVKLLFMTFPNLNAYRVIINALHVRIKIVHTVILVMEPIEIILVYQTVYVQITFLITM